MSEIQIIKNQNNKVATRRNDLLEARYRLTLQEQRLMLWVISAIQPNDEDLKTYRINIKELAEIIGINDKDIYARMKATTKKLMRRIIETWDGQEFTQMALLASTVYNSGQGTVDIEISQRLKKYLLQIKGNFTKIRLKYAFRLSSTYALRIYELLVQYQKIGERVLTVEKLRIMLDISQEKYARWDHFEDRILKSSKKEINQKTDINVTYEKIKNGKKIQAIKFFIEVKKEGKNLLKLPQNLVEKTNNLAHLMMHDIDEKTAENWEKKYSNKEITQALSLLKSDLDKGKIISNHGGWLRGALENGWKDTVSEQKEKEQETQKQEREKELEQAQVKALKNAQEKAYSDYRTHCIQTSVKSLTDESERQLRDVLRDTLQAELPQIMHKNMKEFHAQGKLWLHPQYRRFVEPLLERENGLEVKSFEQFLAEDFESK